MPKIWAVVSEFTAVVAMLKVAVVRPGKTVTVDGTLATGFELIRAITVPEGPAGRSRVTVPTEA